MTPIGIQLTLNGQKEVSSGLQQVGKDMDKLGGSGQQLGNLSQGMGAAARTAGQLQQATQQLPLQFQDIVVSLQAGQAPLTVFLQQGSQLAGSFGSAGAAAKAMAGYVVGLINPITVLGAGVAAVGVAYYQSSKEQDAWIKGIVTTGNASGVTTSQLREYARQIDDVVGTQQQAAAGLADFVEAGVRGGDELRRYTEAAVMWEKATGQAVSTTAKQFADLQNAPLQAVIKLNEGTNFLTTSVYEQVKALEAQGDKVGAAQVAMDALEGSMRERSKQIADSLGYLERGWNAIAGAAKEGWDAMLGVGRKATTGDEIARVTAELDKRMTQPLAVDNDAMRASREKGIANLQRELMLLQDKLALDELNAAAAAHSAQQTKARIEFDGKYSKVLEDQVTLQQKLSTARAEAVAAGKSEADIQKVLAYVTEEHNKSLQKGGSAAKQAQTSYQTLLSTINQKIVAMQSEAKAGEKLTEAEKLRARYQEESNTKGRQFTAQQRERIEAALQVLATEEQQAIASRELAKAHEDDAKALERLTQQRERSVRSLEDSVQKARDEEQAAAMAAASNITNAQALAQVAVARAEDAYQQAVANGEAPKTLDFLEREMKARRELATLMDQRVVREANDQAAKDAAKSWDKVVDGLGDGLYSAIVNDGSNALQALARAAQATLLRPMVQYAANNMAGALGLGPAGSASSMSTAASMMQNGSSLYGALTGSLTYGLGSAIAGMGTALGSAAATSFGAGMAASGFTAGAFGTGASLVGAGATSTGLGMMAGAALPWIGGALAVASLLKGAFSGEHRTGSQYGIAYDGTVVNNRRGQTYTNDGQNYRNPNATGAALTDGRAYWMEGADPSDADSSVAKAIEITAAGIDDLFEMLGSDARLSGFWAGFETSGKGRGGVMSGGMLSDGTIFGEDGKGDNYAGTLYEKFSSTSPDFEKALEDFELDLKQVTLQALQAADDLPASIAKMLDGVETELMAEDAVDALLLKIQGIAVGAAALSNALDLMDMSKPAGNIIDFTAALSEFNGGLDNSLALLGGFYTSFYSEEERMAAAMEQLKKAMSDVGVNIDPAEGDAAMRKYRDAVNAAIAADNAELYAALLSMSGAFAEAANYAAAAAEAAADAAKRAAEEAQQKQLDAAWANYEAAVNRERELLQARMSDLQQSISTLSSMQNVLKAGADALYGNVDSTNQARAVEGMLYIESALAAARQGADMTSFTGLSDAVTATRQGLAAGKYTSQFEKERDQLVWAGQFAELGDLAGEQLSVDERQLQALTDQLDAYDRQLKATRDLIDGVDLLIDKTLSPGAAYDILMRVFKGAGGDGGKPAAGGGASGPSWGAGSGVAAPAGDSGSSTYIRDTWMYDNYYRGVGTNDTRLDPLADLMRKYTGTGDVKGMLEAAKAAGFTLSDVQAASTAVDPVYRESTYQQWLEAAKLAGVPKFESGGLHAGGLRLVGERGPELEVTGAARYWSASQTQQLLSGGKRTDDSVLLQALQRVEIALQAIAREAGVTAKNSGGLPKVADAIERAAAGNGLRVKVIA